MKDCKYDFQCQIEKHCFHHFIIEKLSLAFKEGQEGLSLFAALFWFSLVSVLLLPPSVFTSVHQTLYLYLSPRITIALIPVLTIVTLRMSL